MGLVLWRDWFMHYFLCRHPIAEDHLSPGLLCFLHPTILLGSGKERPKCWTPIICREDQGGVLGLAWISTGHSGYLRSEPEDRKFCLTPSLPPLPMPFKYIELKNIYSDILGMCIVAYYWSHIRYKGFPFILSFKSFVLWILSHTPCFGEYIPWNIGTWC